MSDPSIAKIDGFTSTIHHKVPSSLQPNLATLPPKFTVCIIGASAGIGEHIAYAYAHAHSSTIIIASRTLSDLARVSTKINSINTSTTVETAVCDIANAESVKSLADLVRRKYGRLDVLIPNAAYAPPIFTALKITEGAPDLVQRAFEVNFMGTYNAAHYFIPLLLATRDGAKAFVAIGSIAGCLRRGPIANTGYTISKMAQNRLVEYLAEQYEGDDDGGLLAVAVHPGAVMTDMARGNTPEVFLPYLEDDVDLCGAFCVWLSTQVESLRWLNGRLVSANWDVDELMAKKDEIVEKDLLKFAMTTS